MMTVSPGFIDLIALTAAGFRTPSQTVVPSRLRSSIEYVSGSVFARKYATAVTSCSGCRTESLALSCFIPPAHFVQSYGFLEAFGDKLATVGEEEAFAGAEAAHGVGDQYLASLGF